MSLSCLWKLVFSRGATLSFCLAASSFTLPAQTPTVAAGALYQDASAPLDARVQDLLHRMTIEEKIGQLVNHAPAIPRLGIPEYDWWNEALHGVARSGTATVFPQTIGLAATWDTLLIHRMADVISTEARAKHNQAMRDNDHRRHTGLTYWSPNINIDRDPRWGRGMETYGEDPFLTGRLAVAFVEGMQGDNAQYLKTISTPKHFAVHSGPEPLRHGFNVDVSPHDLEDTYLPAFRAAIIEGHADSVMCAYNAIDGKAACDNDLLLRQHLRSDWHFGGYVVSDCDAVADIARGHHEALDNAHASALALKSGTDLDCGRAYNALPEALKAGLVTEADIDRALTRLYTARFRLGMFDPQRRVPYAQIPITENHSPAHQELALAAARESIVLLKNDGVLPVKHTVKHIAVIGPSAAEIAVLEGNYNGTALRALLPVDAMRQQFAGRASVTYAPGSIYVDGAPATLPSSALKPETGGAAKGLTGEYFDHPDFTGTPRVQRVDERIQFDWNRVSPVEGIPASGFAVRWTGIFVPPMPGMYTLGFRGRADTYRVFVDGKLALDGKGTAQLNCSDTAPHTLKIEYNHSPDNTDVGLEWQPPAQALLQPAIAMAQSADIVVAFVGLSPYLEGEQMNVHADGFNGGDRTGIELPRVQEDLLRGLKATGKPLVVVLTSGSAVASPWLVENADAVLEAWYPGERGGQAIAETLAGVNNPAGRLPITFYRATADLPSFENYSMAGRTYRYFNGPVLYRFGYGLSYTRFRHTPLQLSTHDLAAGQPLRVRTKVTNAGKMAGDTAVSLFVVPPSRPGAPQRELVAFSRIHLAAGETKPVTLEIDPRSLSLVAQDGTRSIAEGEYGLALDEGISPQAPKPETTFHIRGTVPLPR
jgi:beta-glucosidase